MEFALSPDQRQFQNSLRGVLERLSPLARVRRFADTQESLASELWEGLVDLGATALLIPESQGGLGLTLLDAALVAEALGAFAAPTPFLGSAVLAPLALSCGSAAQQDRWLPGLLNGHTIAGVAISEAVAGARDGAGVTATDGRLTGRSSFVIDAAAADVFVVADRAGELHLVDGGAEGLVRTPLTTIDLTRPLGEVSFDNTPCEPLDAKPGGLQHLRDAAWVLLAADTLGAAETLLDKAVAYAQERQQFGRPIGSFQAVKHLCAEMAAEIEPARSLIWYAAYALSERLEDGPLAAAHAKAHWSEVGRFVARTSTEVHGGMGITDLLGLHYWFKRVGLNRQLLGGPERVRHEAAVIQGFVSA